MNILVVDDENIVYNTIVPYLGDRGNEVEYAVNGLEALELIKESSPQIVLTDLHMPVMDGMTLLNKIKEYDEDIGVVIISGHGDMDLVIEAHRKGAFGWIKKPVDFRELDLVLESTENYQRVRKERRQAREQVSLLGKGGALDDIIGDSKPIEKLKNLISKVAQTERTTVMITGETGTGKELVARAIHGCSRRASQPFIPVNCTALSSGIAESELFGHEPGAFTGARGRKAGFFELAQGGTIFLDEIGDMDLALQSRLLRVLEEYSFFRVGGKKEISVDVRVIAATNCDLHNMADEGTFRLDLLHRLEVFTIPTPPLRTISSDLDKLISFFISAFNSDLKTEIEGVDKVALNNLKEYPFPGNIRELRNMLERAMILASGNMLMPEDFNLTQKAGHSVSNVPFQGFPEGISLMEMEQKMIDWALNESGGVKTKAADLLGISREALRRRLEKYDME